MAVYRVTVRAVFDIDTNTLSAFEIKHLIQNYQPTPESPHPDQEWIAEEWAMACCANAVDLTVEDSHVHKGIG